MPLLSVLPTECGGAEFNNMYWDSNVEAHPRSTS